VTLVERVIDVSDGELLPLPDLGPLVQESDEPVRITNLEIRGYRGLAHRRRRARRWRGYVCGRSRVVV